MREQIIIQVIDLLEKKGFLVSSYLHSNNCFDIAAKKGNQLLLIKVFENIDATRSEQALELKKLSTALFATALIIGEKTKTAFLSDSLVYERYGLNCITFNSFKDFLNNIFPKAWHFKGKTLVELDSQKLRQARQIRGLTLSELARQLNSTPKSLHGYEKGTHSSMKTARKLEKILSTPLIKKIDLEKKHGQQEIFEQRIDDPIFEKIVKLGLDLEIFEYAPFEAFSHPKESLLISKAEHKRDVKRKGLMLNKTKKVVSADSVIIAKKFDKKSTGNIAVVEMEELDSFSKKKSFLDTIKEREMDEREILRGKKKTAS